MVVRLSAAVLLTGLAFATPSHAEVAALDPGQFLDAHESETAALIAVDLAFLRNSAVPQSPGDEARMAEPESRDTIVVEQPLEPPVAAALAEVAFSDEHAASLLLMPELFLDLREAETLSWIAADLTSIEDLATGSTLIQSAGVKPDPEADQAFVDSLTDDALPFEIQPTR